MSMTIDGRGLFCSLRPVIALTVGLGLAGCQTAPPGPDRMTVANQIRQRFDPSLPAQTTPGEMVLPPGAALEDGLTDDEAVSIALWNNAAFQELLVDLGLARGDLIQAGLLPNPEFVYHWSVTDKPFKYLFDFPIESLWLRPLRVRSASGEAERAAERLTQAGLDLIRDVRQAYADVVLANERVRVAGESVKYRRRIADLAGKRLAAGEISEQEAATARIDALQAEQDATRAGFEVPVLGERLRNLMGVGLHRAALSLDPLPPPPCLTLDPDALTQDAMRCRPDALAAVAAIGAAAARRDLARLGWVRFLGIADATSGTNGHEFGPALRFTIPLFNRNEGGIARADAEYERAVRNQQTVSYQIILDVQRAYLQYRQACAERDILLTKVRPEVEAAIRRAQAGYEGGNVPIFIVLETTRQLLDNYLREAILTADVRRFWAELERSVGKRLDRGTAPQTDSPPLTQADSENQPIPAPADAGKPR